jgi:hypothetical protein
MNSKSWKHKIDYLKKIRNDIKKKRFILDEGKERFGLDEMYQLIKVKNTSEVKGYPFKVKKKIDNETFKFGLKIIPISNNYEKNDHPSLLESIVLKELTDNIVHKNISPHIVYYLGNQKVSNKSKALKFLNLKRLEIENEIKNHSYMLISEYVSGGSLDNWVFNTYENDDNIADIQWKYIVFQLIYTIAVMQKKYRLMHNDFHYGNILIDTSIKPEGYFVYKIYDQTFYIKNTGIIPKLWDFEFSMCYSNNMEDFYPNKFILAGLKYDKKKHITLNEEDLKDHLNVPVNYNEFYDLHYFLTSLLDLYISQELFDWIMKLYPAELIPEEESTSDSTTTSTSCSSDTDSTTDSDSTTVSDTDTDTDTDSTTTTDTTTTTTDTTTTTTDTSSEQEYIEEGRLMNGVEKVFDLPIPFTILKDGFFNFLKIKPEDFEEKTAIYFNAGF